jgi:hypothetical protein
MPGVCSTAHEEVRLQKNAKLLAAPKVTHQHLDVFPKALHHKGCLLRYDPEQNN